MSKKHHANSIIGPKNANYDAYVSLKRLSEEEINRFTRRDHNDQLQFNSSIQTIKIKREYPENGFTESYGQELECTSIVKIETTTTTIREIKSEPLESYEENIDNISNNLNTNMHNTFNCDICYAVFDDFEMLFIHKSVYHQNKPYACDFCDQRFSLSLHLNIHIGEHVSDFRTNKRAVTDIQSTSRSHLTHNYKNRKSIKMLQDSFNNSPKNLQKKINLKQRKLCENKVSVMSTQKYCASNSNKFLQNTRECKPFKCPNCLFSSASENKFLNHHNACNINLDNNSYIPENQHLCCDLCMKTFKNQTSLNGHMRYHSLRGEIISKKKLKKKKSNNIVKSPQNDICTQKSGIKCKQCNRNFISLRKLTIHYKQHKKEMMCTTCHKQFFLEKSFKKHLRTHKNLTMKKNNGKNSSFNKDHSFNVRKSSKQKSFKVKFFTKKITDDKKLQENCLKDMKTFQCLYCDKYYKTVKSLAEHKRRYHANLKPKIQRLTSMKCNWCSAVITKCNLIRHINSFHPNVKPLKCAHCPMKFKNHSSMKSHIKNRHKHK